MEIKPTEIYENEVMHKILIIIEQYYGDRKAERSGVPYMNHIYEGLHIMEHLNMRVSSKIVYALHPIFQTEGYDKAIEIIINLSRNAKLLITSDLMQIFMECDEYRKVANSYLSKDHVIGGVVKLPDLTTCSVKDALIADKVQNYKDFELYHKGTHEKSELLEDYFKAWLQVLTVSPNVYQELKRFCRKKRMVFFTGAGVSAESGIDTFRDSDGTWEKVKIEDVATPSAWRKSRETVLDFYNARLKQLDQVEPNDAHKLIAKFEKRFDVTVITQNVDDLHERGGSTNVIHLHGELRKKCSSLQNGFHITDIPKGEIIELGSKAPDGSQWRPHIVWFGESVPNMQAALLKVADADVLTVVGTSLNVYPAASIADSNMADKIYQIDPNEESLSNNPKVNLIQKTATEGMQYLYENVV